MNLYFENKPQVVLARHTWETSQHTASQDSRLGTGNVCISHTPHIWKRSSQVSGQNKASLSSSVGMLAINVLMSEIEESAMKEVKCFCLLGLRASSFCSNKRYVLVTSVVRSL